MPARKATKRKTARAKAPARTAYSVAEALESLEGRRRKGTGKRRGADLDLDSIP